MKSSWLTFAVLCSVLAGCATKPPEMLDLNETSWMMRLPEKSHCDVAPMLEFSAGVFTGELGCNRVKGTYTLKGTALTFENVALTRKLCSRDAMEREAQMLRLIEKTRRVQRVGEDLRFLTEENQEILTLTPEILGTCR